LEYYLIPEKYLELIALAASDLLVPFLPLGDYCGDFETIESYFISAIILEIEYFSSLSGNRIQR